MQEALASAFGLQDGEYLRPETAIIDLNGECREYMICREGDSVFLKEYGAPSLICTEIIVPISDINNTVVAREWKNNLVADLSRLEFCHPEWDHLEELFIEIEKRCGVKIHNSNVDSFSGTIILYPQFKDYIVRASEAMNGVSRMPLILPDYDIEKPYEITVFCDGDFALIHKWDNEFFVTDLRYPTVGKLVYEPIVAIHVENGYQSTTLKIQSRESFSYRMIEQFLEISGISESGDSVEIEVTNNL